MNDYAECLRRGSDYLYVLRRTVPPWRWQENLAELVEMCPKYGIDEVCVKIDTGTFTHYFPDFDWLKNEQKILFEIKKQLNAVGVGYSLNPNVTQGHGDRGRNICDQHPDWPMITAPDGGHSVDCACNIGAGWREYIAGQWNLYAETKPLAIWMEDDLRTFGHGSVHIGCFCQEHLRRFNAKLGLSLSREEVVKGVFSPGVPGPLRSEWLKFLDEMTREVIVLCEKTVHNVSPETVFGLMSSGPANHAREGRDWKALYDAFSGSGKHPVLSRPPLGNYSESSLTGLGYTAASVVFTRKCFGNEAIEEGEIENFPYTGYSKSNLFLNLQNSVAIGCGCEALTLNLFDHCGTPMEQTEDILTALKIGKPYLAALKKAVVPRGEAAGVPVFFNPESGKTKQLKPGESDCADTVTAASEMLKQLGIASFCGTPKPSTPVSVLAGQSIRSASGTEIRSLLSRGVFLDSVAFQALCQMGYSRLLGADCGKTFQLNTTFPLAGERFFHPGFGGSEQHAFSLAIHGQTPMFAEILAAPEAEEVTEFVDPDFKRIFPGTTIFINELGGKIVLFPLEIAGLCGGFRTPMRKHFMLELLKWASDGRLPMTVSGARALLPIRFDRRGSILAGIYNLSPDPLSKVVMEMTVEQKPEKVEKLAYGAARWERTTDFECDGNKLVLTLPELHSHAPVWFQIGSGGAI